MTERRDRTGEPLPSPWDESPVIDALEAELHTVALVYPDNIGARRLAARLAARVTDHHRRPPTPTAVLAEAEPIAAIIRSLREALALAREAAERPCDACGAPTRTNATPDTAGEQESAA